MIKKDVTPEDYRRIFEELPGGPQVLDDITRRFGREAYVKGGTEGDRETCYRAGQRSVLDFILSQINKADGVEDYVED